MSPPSPLCPAGWLCPGRGRTFYWYCGVLSVVHQYSGGLTREPTTILTDHLEANLTEMYNLKSLKYIS